MQLLVQIAEIFKDRKFTEVLYFPKILGALTFWRLNKN